MGGGKGSREERGEEEEEAGGWGLLGLERCLWVPLAQGAAAPNCAGRPGTLLAGLLLWSLGCCPSTWAQGTRRDVCPLHFYSDSFAKTADPPPPSPYTAHSLWEIWSK